VTGGHDLPVIPGREEFRALAAGGRPVPVYRTVPADQETPVSAFRKLDDGAHAFLLESLEGGEKWGRYSMVGSRPGRVFVARGQRCVMVEDGATRPCAGPPLEELRALLAGPQAVALPGLPRFCGGAVGFLGAGAARWFERQPATAPAASGPPDAVFLVTGVVTVFDHVAHTVKVVTHARGGDDPDAAWAAAAGRLDAEIARLEAPLGWPARAAGGALEQPASSLPRERFESVVERVRARIRAGEVLQWTLARHLSVSFQVPAFDLYRALRLTAPSPYGHFLRLGGLCLAGYAPGSLVRRTGDSIEAHVLAGTRPRGRTEEEEGRLEEELRTGEQERAAHALLVDLARSDIGGVAEPGTVDTREWMEVERQSQAMHLASTVRGRPRQDTGPLELLRACFPAGADCGVPRARALELIGDLEPAARGVLPGAVGYFDLRGGVELCSAAHTLVLGDGRADWSSGAVIAADTDPGAAWRESEDQARGRWLALQRASGGAR
jgi:anthranilate synthase component I